ncbi:hypothetical protein [Nigerium massiliense]|uniref:hypothetical protein n=1 Tax=Nigerium massiliense TaxID=1522317 RepID=UPI00058F52A4|nr:hypothetical protein [Nigerium massiliense]
MRYRSTAVGLIAAALLAGCSAGPAAPPQTDVAAPASSGTPADQATQTSRSVGPDVGWGAAPGTTGETQAGPESTPGPKELPRGGREVFPRYRLFGYSGYPGAKALGRLGIGDINERMVEMEERGQAYRKGRELLPTMELIATIVHGKPGADGMYRTRVDDQVIQSWLDTARQHKAILLLNIQPGRANFIDELKYFEKWLKEPDVGVALDPEWAVDANQKPGAVFGNTTGQELNECAEYVSKIVTDNDLPQKVFLYHQLHVGIVRSETDLKEHPGIALVKSIDGIGSYKMKKETYDVIVKRTPEYVHKGFKLFYEEDTRGSWKLMTPDEVMGLQPEPEYVLFE